MLRFACVLEHKITIFCSCFFLKVDVYVHMLIIKLKVVTNVQEEDLDHFYDEYVADDDDGVEHEVSMQPYWMYLADLLTL